MMSDVNLCGVFLPGLLVIALVTLFCTLLLIPLCAFSTFYRSLPCRPLIGFSTYIFTFFLLMQGVHALRLLA